MKKINNNDNSSSPSQDRTSKLEVNGKLIVVEGIDGSGKSTQIRLVGKWLVQINSSFYDRMEFI